MELATGRIKPVLKIRISGGLMDGEILKQNYGLLAFRQYSLLSNHKMNVCIVVSYNLLQAYCRREP